jgi:chorismate mutase
LARVYRYIRYLVLVTTDGPLEEITYRELQSARELRDGDTVFTDELQMCVRAVLRADDDRYDGQIICRPSID